MAKSKSFFGLRRGSTKSMTFQVLNGGQITKDRVSDVKNPRTQSQMVQRMIMATAGAGYKAMRAICDHSFEGVSYGQKSYSEFMKLNVNAMVNDIKAGNGDFSYNPYGDINLYASPFILSKGSLKNKNTVLGFELEPDYINVGIPTGLEQSETKSLNELMDALGVKIGDMLTICFIFRNELQENWQFGWVRLLFEKGSSEPAEDIALSDYVKVNSTFAEVSLGIESTQFALSILQDGETVEEIYGTTILSRKSNNRWLRSNAYIIFPGSPVNNPTAAQALATYPVGTDYILNGANIGGGIKLYSITWYPKELLSSGDTVMVNFEKPVSCQDILDGKVFFEFLLGGTQPSTGCYFEINNTNISIQGNFDGPGQLHILQFAMFEGVRSQIEMYVRNSMTIEDIYYL